MFAMKETKPQTNLRQNPRKPTLARKCTGKDCPLEKETSLLQRRANLSAPSINEAPPIVHDVLRSSGQPLDDSTRAFMEPRFNQDFSHVRVHTDAKAAESARAVNALAYTVGRDIVMKRDEYAPATDAGKRLLAHELVHVIQQGGNNRLQKLQVGAAGDVYEQEADQVADQVVKMSQPVDEEKTLLRSIYPSVQRTIDTSTLLHTHALSKLYGAVPLTSGTSAEVCRGMEDTAYSNFAAKNPVLNMNVVDKWYYYTPGFRFIETTRYFWKAFVFGEAYLPADDTYKFHFSYQNTATRLRKGTFATSSGKTHSVSSTLTGGVKLTYNILELSASASQNESRSTTNTTTVTATDFYEHDYNVTLRYNASYYNPSDFIVKPGLFYPTIKQVSGPHKVAGTVQVGTITLYDDDSDPDNLTP